MPSLEKLSEDGFMSELNNSFLRAAIESHNRTGDALTRISSKRKQEPDPINVASVLAQLKDGPLQGATAERLAKSCEARGLLFDPNRPNIPFSAIRTPATVAVATTDGFLVDTQVTGLLDVLRPWSIVAKAGITELPGQVGNLTIPRTVGNATASFVTSETQQQGFSNLTIGQIGLSPKRASGIMQFSRLLNLQAPSVALYVIREVQRTLATLIDGVVITGPGTGGQPLGILGTPGINTQSGATFAYATALNGDADTIAGKAGYVSTTVPTATLVAADWSQIAMATWGQGFEISIDPYSGFQNGITAIQVALNLDLAILYPAAVCVAQSIT
jgi:HK97 family phage major capsid protein